MITLGKKVSSCVAVAIVWVVGSLCLQLVSLGILFAVLRQNTERPANAAQSMEMWLAAAMPLIACVGGTAAVWLLRKFSGWPKLPLPSLFLRALVFSVFALALLPAKNILLVAGVADALAIAGATMLTWREAARNELGTHVFPGSTRTEGE